MVLRSQAGEVFQSQGCPWVVLGDIEGAELRDLGRFAFKMHFSRGAHQCHDPEGSAQGILNPAFPPEPQSALWNVLGCAKHHSLETSKARLQQVLDKLIQLDMSQLRISRLLPAQRIPFFPRFCGRAGGWGMVLQFQGDSQDGRSWGCSRGHADFYGFPLFWRRRQEVGKGEAERSGRGDVRVGVLGRRSWSRRVFYQHPRILGYSIPASCRLELRAESEFQSLSVSVELLSCTSSQDQGIWEGPRWDLLPAGSPGFLQGSGAQREAQKFDKNWKKIRIFPFSGEFCPSACTPGHSPGSGQWGRG